MSENSINSEYQILPNFYYMSTYNLIEKLFNKSINKYKGKELQRNRLLEF